MRTYNSKVLKMNPGSHPVILFSVLKILNFLKVNTQEIS